MKSFFKVAQNIVHGRRHLGIYLAAWRCSPYRFERIGNLDQANNGSDNENDGAEKLLNLTLCGRCDVRETARVSAFVVLQNWSRKTSLNEVLCQPVSGYDEFLFNFFFLL